MVQTNLLSPCSGWVSHHKDPVLIFAAVITSRLIQTLTFFRSQYVEKIDTQSTAACSPTTANHLPSALNASDGLVVSLRPLMYLTDCETNDQMQMETWQHQNQNDEIQKQQD